MEIFLESLRPHPIFVRNWDACVKPAIDCITILDYYGEFLARVSHPRVRIETVTQGCPRPMTWVWFDDTPEVEDAPEGVILYLHGGGYWAFTGKSHLEYITRILKAHRATPLRMKACVVDLRRAPEHPWPAPLEDAMACYSFLRNGAGYDASRIVFAGDSAGGGLCLCTLLNLRDAQEPQPLCATVISPLTDLSRCAEQYADEDSRVTPFTDFLIPEAATNSAKYYCEQQEDLKNPYISPKFGELHALCPILIQSGESELLARDSVEYAQRLEIYRGTVQLEMYPDMPHVFPMFAPLGLEDGHTAVRRQAKFVKKVLEGGLEGNRRVQVVSGQKRNMSYDNIRDHNKGGGGSPGGRRMSQIASSPVFATSATKTTIPPKLLLH